MILARDCMVLRTSVAQSRSMSNTLVATQSDRSENYQRDGVIQVRGLLAPDEIAEIRDAFMDQIEKDRTVGFNDRLPSTDPLAMFPRLVQPHRRDDTEIGRLSRKFMLDRRIFDIITELVGPALAAQSMFYFKPPSARGQALHQDNLFLQAHPETCIAAWVAIDDCDADNGALKVIPGSHLIDLLCPEQADETLSFTSGEVRPPADMPIKQTEMKAGDVLFFHGSTVHGSLPNTSADRFRRSLIFHYVPQASVEIARFYQPLLTPAGDTVMIDEAPDGGPCGEGFQPKTEGH